jgi:WD40 repeat protein/tetratricopeptide (TPR) repeat protein
MPAPSCPDHNQILQCALGLASEDSAEQVFQHAEACAACGAELDSLLGARDNLLAGVGASRAQESQATLDHGFPEALPQSSVGFARTVELPAVPGFEVLAERGRGGMGVVYQARQTRLKRLVALKMVLAGELASASEVLRFRLEAEMAARVQHPNIVQVHEVGEWHGRPYLVLEWVDGGSLAQRLAGRPQPPHEAARLVETLARAVHHAHQQGVIHRDLKPANVLLAADGTPKLTDFGLAKSLSARPGLTGTGALLGTPSYMAPEQAGAGQGVVGVATDVYALGVLLYEMLVGRPPFHGPTVLATLEQVRQNDPEPIRRKRREVPADLETICLCCLQKDPARRYATAQALAEDLNRFLTGHPIRARRVGEVERVWKWARRRPAVAALLAVVVATLVAGSAISTYFAVEASRRAGVAQAKEQEANAAKHNADLQAAVSLVRVGLARAQEGAVAEGMYTLLDAWRQAPADAVDLRRLIRCNLAGWSRQLPVLRRAIPRPPDESAGRVQVWLTGPDERVLVTFGFGKMSRWDAENGQPLGAALPLPKGELMGALNQAGTRLAALADNQAALIVRDAGSGASLFGPFRHKDHKGADDRLAFLSFQAGDSLLASSGLDGSCHRFWDPTKRTEAGPPLVLGDRENYYLTRTTQGTLVVAVFPHAVQGSDPSGLRARFVDLASGQARDALPAPVLGDDPRLTWDGKVILSINGDVSTLHQANPRVSKLTSWNDLLVRSEASTLRYPGSCDGSVWRWDTASGALRGEPWRPRREAALSILSRDGTTLAARCDDEHIRLYDLASGLQRGGDISAGGMSYELHAGTGWLAVGPDGGAVATVSQDGTVRLWGTDHLLLQATAAANPRGLPEGSRGLAPTFGNIAYSPNRRCVFVSTGDVVGQLIDCAGGESIGSPLRRDLSFPAFSPDSTLLVTAAWSYASGQTPWIRLWDAATGQPHRPPLKSPKFVYGRPVFSPDGKTLAVPCVGMTLLVDVADWRIRSMLRQDNCLGLAAFSPDGRRIVVASRIGYWAPEGPGYRVWDVDSGQPAGPFHSTPDGLCDFQFRDEGRTLLVLSRSGAGVKDQTVTSLYTCDGTTGAPRGEPAALGQIGRVAFHPDGSLMAASLANGEVLVWDFASGGWVGEPMVQPAPVIGLAYSPDGRMLAAACKDRAVRLWDPLTRLPIGPPLLHRADVLGLAFTPDSRSLVTTTITGATRTWPVPQPVTDDPDRLELWLSVRGGMGRDGARLTLLDAATWQQRHDDLRQRWPDPDRSLAAPPEPADWHEARARDAEEDGDLRAELWHLERLVTLRPDDWRVWARRGSVFTRAGQLGRADEAYTQAAAHGGGAGLINWLRHHAAECRALGAWDKVLWYLERIIALRPDAWEPYADRAEAYEVLGRNSDRDADEARALQRSPDRECLIRLAEAQAKRGRWPEALILFGRAAEQRPFDLMDTYHEGIAALRAGDTETYKAACARALRGIPAIGPGLGVLDALNAAGLCTLGPGGAGDGKTPLSLVEHALAGVRSIKGNDGTVRQIHHALLTIRGALLLRAGDNSGAVQRLTEATEFQPGMDSFEDAVFLALAYQQQGNTGAARAWLERARKAARQSGQNGFWDVAEREVLLGEADARIGR